MRELVLHIGLPKTGSSAIQSWLSINGEVLRGQLQVAYADLNPEAKQFKITSGNASKLLPFFFPAKRDANYDEDKLISTLEESYFLGLHRALISGESLASASRERIDSFSKKCATAGISVTIVAFVRDVFDHCWSAFQQHVKRNGYHKGFAEFVESYKNPQARAISNWSESFRVRLAHYNSAKSDLVAELLRLAGYEAFRGQTEVDTIVNRSLTFEELEILLRVNRLASECGVKLNNVISDALIYAKPDAKSVLIQDDASVASLRERFSADVASINERFFGGNETLKIARSSSAEGEVPAGFVLPDELDPVLKALLKRIRHLEGRLGGQQ